MLKQIVADRINANSATKVVQSIHNRLKLIPTKIVGISRKILIYCNCVYLHKINAELW